MGKMLLTDYTSSYTKYVNSKYYFKLTKYTKLFNGLISNGG